MSLSKLQEKIWDGRLPLEIRLAASECRTYDRSDAYLVGNFPSHHLCAARHGSFSLDFFFNACPHNQRHLKDCHGHSTKAADLSEHAVALPDYLRMPHSIRRTERQKWMIQATDLMSVADLIP